MGKTIRECLKENNYNTAPDSTYDHIETWLEWYQNEVEKFHNYKIYNGTTTTSQRRYRLGMAKKICEDWANLILNEKVKINAGEYEERLNEILRRNNFYVKANQLIEMAFALGTGAFVEYKDGDEVVVDYIRADMIYPIAWENGQVTECAFGSVRTENGEEIIYLQIHRHGNEKDGEKPDVYYIENRYVDAKTGQTMDIPEKMEPIATTDSEKPLFQIIMPNICNNIDLDSPMGISIYANCISELKGCDIVYDSYINEFVLGRKRILVPISNAKRLMEKDGVSEPIFDPGDTVYFMMPGERAEENKLTEVDMTIRAQEHDTAIQRNLDILSMKSGMGTGRYKFDASGGVKTATEVISDKSDLYQNRQKNAIIIREAVTNLADVVSFLDTGKRIEATIDFDDSIIEDTGATIDKNIKLVTAGLRSKVKAIMEINGCSEEEAKRELETIKEDNQVTGQDIDWTVDDNNEDEANDGKEEVDESPGKPESGGEG